MGKPRIPSQKKAYEQLRERMNQYTILVQNVYDSLNKEVSQMVSRLSYDGSKPFKWSDYPSTKQSVKRLQDKFLEQIGGIIYSSTSQEWKESNLAQDLIASKCLKTYGLQSHDKTYERYYQVNSEALEAFQQRVTKGMNLSSKIWEQSKDYKEGIESAISLAVEKGTSAVTLSKRLSKYLKDFPSLQKDYGLKYGKSCKAKNCEHNSIRLARTEINMAYRTAEQARWQQFDFVVGYEIKVSKSHKITDICDAAQGKYPKAFKFSGWHPNCFCYCVPITKTEDEFWSDDEGTSANEVTTIPKGLEEYIHDNKQRFELAKKKGTLPYWAEDNSQYIFAKKSHALQVAEARHASRTVEDVQAILNKKENWDKFDEDEREDYRLIYEWKEELKIDMSELEKLMKAHYEDKETDSDLWWEMHRLKAKVLKAKEPFKDKLHEIGDALYDIGEANVSQIEKLLWEKYQSLPKDVSPQTYKTAIKELENWLDYRDTFTKGLVDIVKPSYSNIRATDDLLTFKEELKILKALCGTNRRSAFNFRQLLDKYESVNSANKSSLSLRLELQEKIKQDEGAVWRCIDDLTELGEAKDLNKIPKYWRLKFNNYMEKVRAFDIEANGYAGVYTEIEGAYNIYKLSTMEEVRLYGIKKVNVNMPHQIFEIWKKNGWDMNTVPNPNLFYYQKTYVPLNCKMNEPFEGWNPKSGAYYWGKFGHVSISEKYFSEGGRANKSPWERTAIFTHEYGHANDDLGNWKHKEKIIEVLEKYEKKYETLSSSELRNKFWTAYGDTKEKHVDDFFSVNDEEEYFESHDVFEDMDIGEQAGAISDVIQLLRKDKMQITHGHSGSYFDRKENRIAEFVAHMSETYWQGNDFLGIFDKDMATDFKKVMKQAYSKKVNALGKTTRL